MKFSHRLNEPLYADPEWEKKAGDQINCMLNYGYALLKAECLRVINSVGLDAHVGFLHEMQPGKNSLAYDFQELFRFVVDWQF